MSFFKALAGQTTAPDAKLFAIRLGIAKATSIDIEYTILITDSLSSTRKAVDLSVHSGQAHFLAVCFVLRLFFSCSLNYRIKFWDCSSNAKWFLYQLVYNNVTNTKVATRLYSTTFINSLYSKSVILCLDT